MYSKSVQNLIEKLSKLPSIGPRQASKIAFFLLKAPEQTSFDLADAIINLRKNVKLCSICFLSHETENNLCHICSNPARKKELICITQKEVEANNIEQSQVFKGVYHVIGEGVNILKNDSTPKSINTLLKRIDKLKAENKDVEIIIATSPTIEGSALSNYLEKFLKQKDVRITFLGRGLSSGNEIEYTDQETIVHAFKNRK